MTTRAIDLSDERPRGGFWRPLLIWTGVVILYTGILHAQVGLPLVAALPSSAVYFYTLALLMIPVTRLSDRILAARARPMITIGKHALMALAVLTTWLLVFVGFQRLSIGPAMWQLVYADSWLFQLLTAVLIYGTALGVVLATLSWKRERALLRREHELEVAARDAELGAVKAQFQPHFVLNALNSVLALVETDPALARTMIIRLSDLMKSVFDRADDDDVPLSQELDLVSAYLDIERIRFGPRLSVALNIEDDARRALVPAFLLQPIVENAVKHGIAPFAESGKIEIAASTRSGRLHVTVRDSGRATQPPEPGTGQGLLITRRRLESRYGDAYRLSLDRSPTGMTVSLDLPVESARVA